MRFVRLALAVTIALGMAGSVLHASSALAQDDSPTAEASEETEIDREREVVEELTVTATKREESIQDIPISIKALSSDFIKDAGLTDFARVQEFVPNLKINPVTDARGTIVRIRGIGSVGSNAGIDPSVGIFIDGVYQGRAGMSTGDLLDIERVEVLRGPQGTLYGKNTAAGAINIISKRPSDEFESTIETVLGNYSNYETRFSLNLPIVEERIASRVSGYWSQRDGYTKNTHYFDSDDRFNDEDKFGFKARTLFNLTDSLEVLLHVDYARQHNKCCVADIVADDTAPTLNTNLTFQNLAAIPGNLPLPKVDEFDRRVGVNVDPSNEVEIGGITLDASYDVGDMGFISDSTINLIAAWRSYDSDSTFDGDFSTYDAVLAYTETDLDQYSLEMRLTSPGGERFEYQTGLFAYYQDQDTIDRNGFEDDFSTLFGLPPTRNIGDNRHETLSFASFGQGTFEFNEQLSLTSGLRFTWERKDRDGTQTSSPSLGTIDIPPIIGPRIELDQTRRESQPSGMVSLRYFPTDEIMAYASVATGFKSGGFNQLRTRVGVPGEFDDEESTNYEIGVKTTWLDGMLTANGTLFYTDYDEFQAQTFDGSSIAVTNAGSLESYGVEAEFVAVPLPNLVLGTSVGFNIAEYTDFKNGEQTSAQRFAETNGNPIVCSGLSANLPAGVTCVQDLEGETLDGAPKWTVSTFFQYDTPVEGRGIEWFLRGEYSYTSSQYLAQDLDPNLKQDAFHIVNLRSGFRRDDGSWEVTGYIKNLIDEEYNVAGFDVPTLNGFAALNGPPREYGVMLRLNF